MAAMAVLSSRSGQIARSPRFGCRFHIAPCKKCISGQAEPYLSRVGKAIGRFIKAGQPQWMAILSRPTSLNSSFSNSGRFIKARQWPQWPVYHQEAAAWRMAGKASGQKLLLKLRIRSLDKVHKEDAATR